MTREEAIEILIAVAVCDRPILSCDFCARYVGMGTDCTYPSDKEIEESVLLPKGASKDMAISALRQQEHFRDLTKKVEPITLDELRKMDGEPAWFVSLRDGFASWGIARVVEMSKVWFIAVAGAERAFGDLDGYGKTWLAYRQKPEEGTL